MHLVETLTTIRWAPKPFTYLRSRIIAVVSSDMIRYVLHRVIFPSWSSNATYFAGSTFSSSWTIVNHFRKKTYLHYNNQILDNQQCRTRSRVRLQNPAPRRLGAALLPSRSRRVTPSNSTKSTSTIIHKMFLTIDKEMRHITQCLSPGDLRQRANRRDIP